jgi:hypothetical protein
MLVSLWAETFTYLLDTIEQGAHELRCGTAVSCEHIHYLLLQAAFVGDVPVAVEN